MEEMAYTWFNRFIAIRYMELHGLLDHGMRVLTPPPRIRATRRNRKSCCMHLTSTFQA